MDADYKANFLTTSFSTQPVAGDKVFSYVELQDLGWDYDAIGAPGFGNPEQATITPRVLDATGAPIDDQPDFSGWGMSKVALTAHFYDVQDGEHWRGRMRYAFFYDIPATWTSDDYPRPADLADDAPHEMRFSFFYEMGGDTVPLYQYDTRFNDFHGEYTMRVEDPEIAAADPDDDDPDDEDAEDAEDAGEAVDAVDNEDDVAEAVEATEDTGGVEESSGKDDNPAAQKTNALVEALQTAGELALVGAATAFVYVFFVMPL